MSGIRNGITVAVGFLHDFAAGCWAASLLAVYYLNSLDAPGLVDQLKALEVRFFWIGLFCVGMVLASGAGRGFTYVPDVYGPGAEKRRRRLLIWKHVLLLGIFSAGILWQYSMAYGWSDR